MTTQLLPPKDAAVAVPLLAVRPGAMACVHEIRDPEARTVLRSLGLIGNSRLRLCKIGDPCIIKVGATRIGLSRTVAGALFVIPE
jgi:Fe2+ transport system protein FeoA